MRHEGNGRRFRLEMETKQEEGWGSWSTSSSALCCSKRRSLAISAWPSFAALALCCMTSAPPKSPPLTPCWSKLKIECCCFNTLLVHQKANRKGSCKSKEIGVFSLLRERHANGKASWEPFTLVPLGSGRGPSPLPLFLRRAGMLSTLHECFSKMSLCKRICAEYMNFCQSSPLSACKLALSALFWSSLVSSLAILRKLNLSW